jgi:hypothetical protein
MNVTNIARAEMPASPKFRLSTINNIILMKAVIDLLFSNSSKYLNARRLNKPIRGSNLRVDPIVRMANAKTRLVIILVSKLITRG